MTIWEIIGEAAPRKPTKPAGGGIAPLTPKQARARSGRQQKAQAGVNDALAANALSLSKARSKLVDASKP